MSRLSGLLDKARAALTGRPALAKDAVIHNRFDAMIHRELVDEVPALTEMSRDLNARYSYTDDLVRDVLMQFWQDTPRLRAQQEMDPSRLANWGVLKRVAELPETLQMRPKTRHDKYGAAMATLGVTSKVREYLQQHKEVEEASKEAEQAQNKAAEAEQEVRAQASFYEEALQRAQQAMNGYEGEGPLTRRQEEASDAAVCAEEDLQDALQVLDDAQGDVAAATTKAGQAADHMELRLLASLREALAEVDAKLTEEQALIRGWGVEPGQLEVMDYAERAALAAMLRGNPVSKFMDLLGRWKRLESGLRAHKVEYGRDEMYAVELGNRLEDVLASEFAMGRAHRMLRLQFLQKFSNRQLLQRKYRGVEKVGQGAVFAVIDTSDSMNQTDKAGVPRAVWAKGFALSLLERARFEERDFVGIIFSSRSQQKTFVFPKGQGDWKQMLEFASEAFNGGTNFEVPMDLAVDMIAQDYNDGRKAADVVFITDDDYRCNARWLDAFRARKQEMGFRVFGVAVGMTKAGGSLTAMSDNVRAVQEFVDPSSVADIMQVV